MVRILHFADLHLGVENYGRLDSATGLHSRLLDFVRSFDEIVDYAMQAPVDLVVFAGDAYKSRDPTPTQQREFASRIHRLVSAGIPVFLLVGNHDLPGASSRASSVDIFATLQVPNVHVGRRIGTHTIATRAGDVQLVAVPWIVRNQLMSREQYKNRSLAELDEITVEILDRLLQAEFERLREDIPAIVVYHGAIQGAVYGSERSVLLGHELVITSLFRHPRVDYVALGHIHRHQVASGSGPLPMVYSGSVDRIDFGEEREPKGFVVADIAKGQSTFKFIPIQSTRRFVTIDVKALDSNPMASLRNAVAREDLRGAIVRLVIHTSEEQNHLLDDGGVRSLLEGAFKVAGVVRQVEIRSRPRLGSGHHIARMAPTDALREYLQVRQLPAQRIDLLLERARALMFPEGRELVA